MRFPTILIALAALALSSAAFGQPAAAPSDKGKSSGSSGASTSASGSHYGMDDCRRDMENARDARQAGHITEKEYAEQKKMALSKLKRDTGQTATTDKDAGCN